MSTVVGEDLPAVGEDLRRTVEHDTEKRASVLKSDTDDDDQAEVLLTHARQRSQFLTPLEQHDISALGLPTRFESRP